MNEMRGDCRLERVNLRQKEVRKNMLQNETSSSMQADLLSS